MNRKIKRTITQELFNYFYDQHNIMLMDEDFYQLFKIIEKAAKNELSTELKRRIADINKTIDSVKNRMNL